MTTKTERPPKPPGCPRAEFMAEHACQNAAQCFEPCGQLGKSEGHVRRMSAVLRAAIRKDFDQR